MFRRNIHVQHATSEYEKHLVEAGIDHTINTIHQLGLDTSQLLVVGGAALELMHIRESQDVDILVPASTLLNLYAARQTPSGLPLSNTRQRPHVLTVSETYGRKGVDILTEFDPTTDGSIEKYDADFISTLAHYPAIDGIHYSTPERILERCRLRRGAKARRDRYLVEACINLHQHDPAHS